MIDLTRHEAGCASLVAEVIRVAILDYKQKRITDEAKTAKRDGRKYAGDMMKRDHDNLRQFIFGGAMDVMIDLAGLRVNPEAIRESLEGSA